MHRVSPLPTPPDWPPTTLIPWVYAPGASTFMADSRPKILRWVVTPSSSTMLTLEVSLHRIEQWYLLPSPESVRRFIRQHPSLADLLVEAIDPLNEFFGPSPRVSLRLVSDPEVEDSSELFAFIRVSFPPDEALRRLHQMDEAWFLDQFDRAAGKFNFNLEFA